MRRGVVAKNLQTASAAMWVRLWNILSHCCRISEIQAIKCCAIQFSWQTTTKFTYCAERWNSHILLIITFDKTLPVCEQKKTKNFQSKSPSGMSPLSSNTNKNSTTVPPQNPSAFERRPCWWKTFSKSLNPIKGEKDGETDKPYSGANCPDKKLQTQTEMLYR